MQNDLPPELAKAMPGVIGAMVALRWIRGTAPQRLAAVLGGSAAAYYETPYMSSIMGTDAGLTGFLIGLFGMAVAAKTFEVLERLDPAALLERLLRKWGA